MTGDDLWRRPSDWQPGPPPAAPAPGPRPAGYTGPPLTTPPPPGWRPQFVVEPPPPRTLPATDPGLDAAEQQARTVTYGVAMVAGTVALILIFVLCARALF